MTSSWCNHQQVLVHRQEVTKVQKCTIIHQNDKNSFVVKAVNRCNDDTFTIVEIQIGLPDFIMGINRFRNLPAWAVLVEVTCYIGNKTKIPSLRIDNQLKFQITAWPNFGNKATKMVLSPSTTQAIISLHWRHLHVTKTEWSRYFVDAVYRCDKKKMEEWKKERRISLLACNNFNSIHYIYLPQKYKHTSTHKHIYCNVV